MKSRKTFRIGAALVLLAVVAASLRAQEPVFTLRVDVPLVSLDVRVLDSSQQPITSLTANDFIVVEDGVEQEIHTFSSIDTPYNIILLFDQSGSTQEQWTFMQRAAERFIRNLRPQDRLALAAFDEGVTMLSGWNESGSAMQQAVKELAKGGSGGGTNLYQSLDRVIQREFRDMSGRRAVVVLTDGQDNQLIGQKGSRERSPFQRTIEVVQTARIPLYFVALNTDRNPSSRFLASEATMREARSRMELLATVSGGGIFFPKNIRDIVPVYDQMSRDLSSSYSLAYTSSHQSVSGETHRIEVRVHGAKVMQSRETYVTP